MHIVPVLACIDKDLLFLYIDFMQSKTLTANYLTEEKLVEVLKEVLKPYPTKKEVEIIVAKVVKREVKKELRKELKNHPTKDDLRKEIQYAEMRTDIKLEQLERRIDDKARAYRDDVLTRMDGV